MSKVTEKMNRDVFPLTEKGARAGLVHLELVIEQETDKAERVKKRIENLTKTNEERLNHVELCKLHRKELKDFLNKGGNK